MAVDATDKKYRVTWMCGNCDKQHIETCDYITMVLGVQELFHRGVTLVTIEDEATAMLNDLERGDRQVH